MSLQRRELGLTFIIVVIGMVALLGLSLTNTTWAAPPGQCVGTICVTPAPTNTPKVPSGPGGPGGPPTVTCPIGDQGVLCINGTKSISVPAGAVVSGTIVSITGPLTQPPCPATPAGQTFLGQCFQVTWTGPGGAAVTFLKPVQDCLTFSAADVAAAGGNAANLFIGFVFDAATQQWTLVKPTVNTATSQVCANVSQIFFFQALFTPTPGLPVTGADPSTYGWVLLVAAGVLVAGFTLRAVRAAAVR